MRAGKEGCSQLPRGLEAVQPLRTTARQLPTKPNAQDLQPASQVCIQPAAPPRARTCTHARTFSGPHSARSWRRAAHLDRTPGGPLVFLSSGRKSYGHPTLPPVLKHTRMGTEGGTKGRQPAGPVTQGPCQEKPPQGQRPGNTVPGRVARVGVQGTSRVTGCSALSFPAGAPGHVR